MIFPVQALGTESFFRLLPKDHRSLERSRRRRSFPMLLATGNDYCPARQIKNAMKQRGVLNDYVRVLND